MFNQKKKINNYILLVGIILVTIILSLLFTKINFSIQKTRIKTSPLSKIVKTIKYEDLDKVKFKDDSLLFIGYTNDEKIYDLEKEIIKIIKENKLEDNFLYMDLSLYKDDQVVLEELNTKLNIISSRINYLPALIYYKDNLPLGIVSSSNYGQVFDSSEAYQLLDVYELVNQ